MYKEKENITQNIIKVGNKCEHAHICDSERKPLGQGNMDFSDYLAALELIDYKFYLSVEAFPSGDYDKDLKVSYEVLKKYVNPE